MNTCGTCKHLGETYEHESWPDDGGDCVMTVYRICGLLQHINDHDRGVSPKHVAGVIDGSGYHAAFCVTDEFGCNQWVARLPLSAPVSLPVSRDVP